MHCIDSTLQRVAALAGALGLTAWLAGCSTPMPPPPWAPPAGTAGTSASPAPVASPTTPPTPAPSPAAPAPESAAAAPAAEPPARSWDEYKMRAARRIAQANAADTFDGPVPQRLASIPVLQVHLNRDGSVRDVQVLRTPKFSPQTVQMAQRAVRRVGNFGPVGHLPQPWQFSETFLYNDDLKFQLRTLAEAH